MKKIIVKFEIVLFFCQLNTTRSSHLFNGTTKNSSLICPRFQRESLLLLLSSGSIRTVLWEALKIKHF